MTAKDETNVTSQAVEAQPVQGQRVDLKGPLEGHYIMVDVDEISFGLVEDIQTGQAAQILDQLAKIILGGDVVNGDEAERRAGLRKLHPRKLGAVINGVTAALALPNAS